MKLELPDIYEKYFSELKTAPWSKIDFYVVIDESDMSEWIAFGVGDNKDSPHLKPLLDTAKKGFALETGLLVTDRIHTIKKGDAVNFSRKIKRPNVDMIAVAMGAPANNYLMKID